MSEQFRRDVDEDVAVKASSFLRALQNTALQRQGFNRHHFESTIGLLLHHGA